MTEDKRELTEKEIFAEAIIAELTTPEGTKEPITLDYLLNLSGYVTDKITKERIYPKESAEILEGLLEKLLASRAETLALVADPDEEAIDELYKAFEKINNFVLRAKEKALATQEEEREKLEEYFDGKKEFMAVPRPRGIGEFLNISVTGNDERLVKVTENITIAFSGRLSIEEQKIHEMLRIAFANMNPHGAQVGLRRTVEIGLTQTMDILGRKDTPRNRKAFIQQLKKEILPTLAHTYIERRTSGKGGRDKIEHWEVGGGKWTADGKEDKIIFRFTEEYAQYLNARTFSQLSYRTLRLGTRKNPLPFYLAQKLQAQYFFDGNRNRAKATNAILSINAILKWCANDFNNCLPSYEDLENTTGKDGRNEARHWGRRIREPLEAALNEIKEKGLFNWEYCGPGMAPVKKKQTTTTDYYEWENLYITFQLIPEEPDQTERLEHKQKRIENAQQKKAAQDAEKIIKADKIQRKNAKKKATADT